MPKESLSMDRVLAAALHIARTEGFQALTMRRLAAELHVTQMAAYYYIKDKEQLVALVADAALEPVRLPGPEAGTWEDRWALQIQSSLEAMASYPGMGQAMASMRLTPHAVRLMHEIVEMLVEAGFTLDDARRAYALMHTYIFGRVVIKERLSYRIAQTDGSHGRDEYFPKPSRHLGSQDFELYAVRAILAGIQMQRLATLGGAGRASDSKEMGSEAIRALTE